MFFEQAADIRAAIRSEIGQFAGTIPHPKLRDIVHQRNTTSSFLKGCIAYYVHEGVGGLLPHPDKVRIATGIEVLCSSGALFDNAIDGHAERNGATTYLREYGLWMQVAASQYVLHAGLKMLLPFMSSFATQFHEYYMVDDAVLGMIGMDIERPTTLEGQIRTTERSNGRFMEVPLIIAATTGTADPETVSSISRFGFGLGTALAIHEEVRDLLGHHGRRRATEVEAGRLPIALHYAQDEAGVDCSQYVGKTLTQHEYSSLMALIVRSGALQKTKALVLSYLTTAFEALQTAVDPLCFERLDRLRAAIQLELQGAVETATMTNG